MQKDPIKKDIINILAISGSLRINSSNTSIVNFIGSLMPTHCKYFIYNELGDLPHFNDAAEIPAIVNRFHQQVTEADGVLICTPEYAFGVPGVLKNAIDWAVGLGSFDRKPVAMISAGTGADKAHASLLLTLQAINADVKDAALNIPFVRSKMNDGKITDETTLKAVQNLVDIFLKNIIASREAAY
ncbi:MAG: NAD(P)H-dependent oxidoreductase [Chitinophagaceae bacterium]|nr:NAD(P)H-dependent oxidoreductase [Chitinophagaceae bacterium]